MTQSQADLIRRRYDEFMSSPEFDHVFRKIDRAAHGFPYWRILVAFAAFMTTIGIPITIYQIVQMVRHGTGEGRRIRRRREEFSDLIRKSVPIMTYPVMVNSMLRRVPGTNAPGLVIGSFDPQANRTVGFMTGIIDRIEDASLNDDPSPEAQALRELLLDETYNPGRRRLLPTTATEGLHVYAFDLAIVGDYLPGGLLEVPMIPCLAEPGPEGSIIMIPSQILDGLVDIPAGP